MSAAVGRFAPSTTGRAHPGTLLAGLLCWLDIRQLGGRMVLRLEDLDPQRSTPALVAACIDDLQWFGLDWDHCEYQHEHDDRHQQAFVELAAKQRLYRCSCSRQQIKQLGRAAADGGWVYDNRCRPALVSDSTEPQGQFAWRCRLQDDDQAIVAEDGFAADLRLSLTAGDPVVRRKDGAVAYHLASVVDDAALAVTRIVRGRDLVHSMPVQIALQRVLGYAQPAYRHHFLLLEPQGDKLAKFHGSVGCDVLRQCMSAQELCGLLAHVAGLREDARPCCPADLLADFAWDKVQTADQVLAWDGQQLQWRGAADAADAGGTA